MNYASEDRQIAEWLTAELRKQGVIDIWLDRQSLAGGDDWKQEIDLALAKVQVLVAILTETSIDQNRRWIKYEQLEAQRLFKWVLPLKFDKIPAQKLPPHMARLNYTDFTQDREKGLRELVASLRKRVLRPGEQFVNQVPSIRRPFVGRESDLKNIVDMIYGADDGSITQTSDSVAVQGMGGVGKTMIAEELVRRLAPRYPGGVIVERRGQQPEPASAVLQRWAEYALGNRPDRALSAADTRSMLENYGRMLILFDDISEDDFGEIRTLLDAVPPDSTRLFTTRLRDIHMLGCQVYSLSSLSEEDAFALMRDRLRQKGGTPDIGAMRELNEMVHGHALSLELMAGRCGHSDDLPDLVDELKESIADDLEDLEIAMMTADRDSSVAHSLALSYRDLEKYDERKGTDWAERFKTLGIFPDNASMDKEMIVAAWGEVSEGNRKATRALSGLYKRAMINRDTETGLYFNHPLLRTYAFGLLKNPMHQFTEARANYIRYITLKADNGFRLAPEYWDQMDMYIPHIQYVGDGLVYGVTKMLGQLTLHSEPENSEMLYQRSFSDETMRELRMGLAFTQAVAEYVRRRPEIGGVGLQWLQMGLVCSRSLDDKDDAAKFLFQLGLWYSKSDYTLAMRYYEAALRISREIDMSRLTGEILSHKGDLHRKMYDFDAGFAAVEEALEIHRNNGDRLQQANALMILGELWWTKTLPEKALEHHNEALVIYKEQGDVAGEGDMANMIGSCYFVSGKHEQALEHFNEALRIHRQVGNKLKEALDLNDMGASLRHSARWQDALDALAESLKLRKSVGGLRLQVITLDHMAVCNIELGNEAKGIELLNEALKIAERLKIKREISRLMWGWGRLMQIRGNYAEALDYWQKSLDLANDIENHHQRAGAMGKMAEIYIREYGRNDDARELLEQSITILEEAQLTQGFGGMYITDMQALIADAEQA